MNMINILPLQKLNMNKDQAYPVVNPLYEDSVLYQKAVLFLTLALVFGFTGFIVGLLILICVVIDVIKL